MPITADTSGGTIPPRRRTMSAIEVGTEDAKACEAAQAAQAARSQERGLRILREAVHAGAAVPVSPWLVHAQPGHCYQQEFDRQAKCGDFVVWDNVAIYGTAAALAAGNHVDECRRELAMWWPGDPRRVEELIQEGRAQDVVNIVREALLRRTKAVTPAGVILLDAVEAAGLDNRAARLAVAVNLRSNLLAVALDPALRGWRSWLRL